MHILKRTGKRPIPGILFPLALRFACAWLLYSILWQPVAALPLCFEETWESTLLSSFQGSSQQVSILTELNRVDRTVKLESYQRLPYSILGDRGNAELSDKGYAISSSGPMSPPDTGWH
jgi:hypothetical protein